MSVSKGAILTVSVRWIDRLIGLTSMVILARLLAPDDFGLIAMAMLVLGLVDILLDLGVNVALIQNAHPTQDHYDSAWTLRLIQSGLTSALIFMAAPFAANYFGDARVESVLYFLAFAPFLRSFENIGIVTFQKEMRFGRDFYFTFLKRMIGFVATIASALLMKNYWALVAGSLIGTAGTVLLSYAIHPMRPRLSFKKMRDIFKVSQWMLVNSIGSFASNNLHRFIVGRRESAEVMGAYSVANEISVMPTTELLAPLNRVLFPAFVHVKDNLQELKRMFLLAQGVQMLVAIPAAVGLALVATEAVHLLLGDKWDSAVPFIQVLVLVNVIGAFVTSGGYVLMTLGHMRVVVISVWLQVILFVVGVFLFQGFGALQIAWLRLAVTMAGLFYFTYVLLHAIHGLRLTDVLLSVTRPLIGTAIMALAIATVSNATTSSNAMLFLKISTGLVSYISAITLLWLVMGKPQGPESYLLDKARFLVRR